MSDGIASLPRDVLTRVLGGDVRAVRAFEQEASNNADTAALLASNAGATDALQDATVITLSPNAAFNNERVLRVGDGIRATDDGATLTLSVNDDVAHVQGGFRLGLVVGGATVLVLPLRGILATLAEAETLSNKTIDHPVLSGVAEYADDAAASTGGVPVGGVYSNAGALRIRRA